MNKTLTIMLALFIGIYSFNVIACPKGQHPHGGTDTHHKGGYCSFD